VRDDNTRTRLYYVEDNAEVRRRIDRELSRIEGVEVLGYSEKAVEALREIRRRRPDVVVLDLQLLEGNGADVLKGLRDDDAKPVIFVLTNHSDPVIRERSRKAGATHFFDKSTEFELFIDTLKRLGACQTDDYEPSA
jgi:DNA-binding NarL/FixJ family response regulator